MSTLVQGYGERASFAAEAPTAVRTSESIRESGSSLSPLYRELIQSLAQQLFFNESAPVRRIGLINAADSPEAEHLCFDLARVMADDGRYDIGLIDANPFSVPLEVQLELSPSSAPDSAWLVAPRLWVVPRRDWIPPGEARIDQCTARLRELAAEFDFSILHCPSVSWVTSRVGRACDGFVLALTAHRTRRSAVLRIRDQIQKTGVPLLGTVLMERRFPIPEALYHSL